MLCAHISPLATQSISGRGLFYEKLRRFFVPGSISSGRFHDFISVHPDCDISFARRDRHGVLLISSKSALIMASRSSVWSNWTVIHSRLNGSRYTIFNSRGCFNIYGCFDIYFRPASALILICRDTRAYSVVRDRGSLQRKSDSI